MPDLTMGETEKIIRAGLAEAQKMGVKISIAVVDANGNLMGMMRMDGARFISADICQGKARASAWMQDTSAALQQRAQGSIIMQALITREAGKFLPSQGAVPIRKGGAVVGAVGVSGAAAQQDEDISKAGIAAIA
ncbi:MAG: hypothetical protein FJ320_01560 [SAR202 cluster bacterium]|nr:hypothetical protein [SAR202 cluster bacterium]